MNKKERERLKRQKAERESKARSESEHRQERINVLWKALTSGSLAPKDKDSADSEPLHSLVELVDLQKREIEHITEIYRKLWWVCAYHNELPENPSVDVKSRLQFVAMLIRIGESHPFITKSKSPYEHKRRGYNRDGIGEIERQFGLGEYPISALSPYGPLCLDEIFKGGAVNMVRLQKLFGVHRNRFPKDLPRRETGRETLYDWRAVVKIMKALLSKKKTMREKGVRGGSQRSLWPVAPGLRVRVLQGIKERMNDISVPKQVKSAFRRVIRPHLPDSAK